MKKYVIFEHKINGKYISTSDFRYTGLWYICEYRSPHFREKRRDLRLEVEFYIPNSDLNKQRHFVSEEKFEEVNICTNNYVGTERDTFK